MQPFATPQTPYIMAKPPPSTSYTPSEEELALLEGCIAGDRRAQKALYDRYKDAMYTLAYRITNDFDQAHDVLQEAFLAVFRGLDRFRRESTLGAWVKTIVVRTAYKKLRRQPVMEPLEESHTREMIDWGDHLDAAYLEQAIQALPPGYRSVFVLIEIEGYAHKEVAALLGISVGTSKSQLYHAKRQLQRTINALGLRA
jgi:RNA polymerase sigma factor (sigma-70 family)